MERGHATTGVTPIAVGSLVALATAGAILAGTSRPLLSTSTAGTDRAADRPAAIVKPLSCEPLPHVPGMALTTAVVTFPPRAYSPAHRHPGSVTAFVLKGAVRSQMAGGPAQTYPVGATWFEPPGALHLFAENPSDSKTAEILAVFVADGGCGPLVIPEPQE